MKKQDRFLFALLCFVILSLSMPTEIANAEETSVTEINEVFNDGTPVEEVKTEVLNEMPNNNMNNNMNDDTAIKEEIIVGESVANELYLSTEIQVICSLNFRSLMFQNMHL